MPRSLTRRDLARLFSPRAKTGGEETVLSSADAFERLLLSRAAWGATPADLDDVNRYGWRIWLELQLIPSALSDQNTETGIRQLLAPRFSNDWVQSEFVYRCVYSKRQLAMRLVWFFNNHFNTQLSTTVAAAEFWENTRFLQEIAGNRGDNLLFGTFRRLLHHSAKSAAMIDYLDSASNVAGAPNENYARELMELHTVGINGGYTEDDVQEAARIFTGWNRRYIETPEGNIETTKFVFDPSTHDSGPKTLSGLGFSTPGYSGRDGVREGEEFLDFLAAHPATAERLCTKLCAYFLTDNPDPAAVQRVQAAFDRTRGHLGSTVRAIFLDPEFARSAQTKGMDGMEYVVSAARRLGLRTQDVVPVVEEIRALGVAVHDNPVPTGYPEAASAWRGVGNVFPRWDFADRFANNRAHSSLRFDWGRLMPSVTPHDAQGWVMWMLDLLVDRRVPMSTLNDLTAFFEPLFENNSSNNPRTPLFQQHLSTLASIVLSLPEAQLN